MEALKNTLTHLTRRNFFRSTLGLLAGAILPKSLLDDFKVDTYLDGKFVGGQVWSRCLTPEEVRILSTGSTWRRPYGMLPNKWHHIVASFKEGSSKSRAYGHNESWSMQWGIENEEIVTVGRKENESTD